jgi:type VI secretion system Hcp family effector
MGVTNVAQGDCFLKLVSTRAGVIKAETIDQQFGGYIAVTAFNWGLQTPVEAGGFRSTGRTAARAFEFVCNVDTAYPALVSALANNDSFKTAVLEMRRAGGGTVSTKPQHFMTISFTKARLSSLQISHSLAELIPVIRASLVFETIEITYRSQGKDGADSGGGNTVSWSIADQM